MSKVEREYLRNIEKFEDEHPFYGKVVRSRIRGRVERAIKDVILVIEKDGGGKEAN